jgi:predicted transcriptional regulator/rubrerythrin
VKATNEERMLSSVRASVSDRLLRMGFRVSEIARLLDVTPAAVTQYSKGARGKRLTENDNQKRIIEALAEKGSQRIRRNMGTLSTVELLDVAHEVLAVTAGEGMLRESSDDGKRSRSIAILKGRLQLELKAAQKCLDLANRAKDDYTRLLLRMVASDSIRHADIVSQILSWLENEREIPNEGYDPELLTEILAIEDNANEFSLLRSVKIDHAVAKLLLQSIDMDEEKHDRLIGKLADASKIGTSEMDRK